MIVDTSALEKATERLEAASALPDTFLPNLADDVTAATAAVGSAPRATAAATAWAALPRFTAPGRASVIGSTSPSGP